MKYRKKGGAAKVGKVEEEKEEDGEMEDETREPFEYYAPAGSRGGGCWNVCLRSRYTFKWLKVV